MNISRGFFLAAVIFMLFSVAGLARAQSTESALTFGVDIRTRYELQNNFNQKYYGDAPAQGQANDGFVLGRLRAGFDWRPTAKIHLAVWGQSADAWDYAMPDAAYYSKTFDMVNHPQKDRWELYTTYVELTDLIAADLSLKVGRQKIFYGDKRVFGPGEWGNSGRWVWDAAKVSWGFKRGFVDVYYGRTMLHEVDNFSLNHRHGFASMGIYSHIDVLPPSAQLQLAIEPMLFSKDDKHQRYSGEVDKTMGELTSWYVGARVEGQWRDLTFSATWLQERGEYGADDIDAYGYHAMLAYKFTLPWQPQIKLAYSYASGDSDPYDGENGTFHGAFGAKDKMYGRMNLFAWSNLEDYEAGLSLKPHKKLSVTTEVHQFKLANSRDGWSLNSSTYRDKTGQSGTDVGKELDIVIAYKPIPEHTFTTGFGHFWPDEFAEKMASNKQANWFFFQWECRFSSAVL